MTLSFLFFSLEKQTHTHAQKHIIYRIYHLFLYFVIFTSFPILFLLCSSILPFLVTHVVLISSTVFYAQRLTRPADIVVVAVVHLLRSNVAPVAAGVVTQATTRGTASTAVTPATPHP